MTAREKVKQFPNNTGFLATIAQGFKEILNANNKPPVLSLKGVLNTLGQTVPFFNGNALLRLWAMLPVCFKSLPALRDLQCCTSALSYRVLGVHPDALPTPLFLPGNRL